MPANAARSRSEDYKLRLTAIDWDFTTQTASHPIHSIHPYPAKFIPDVPRSFLSILPVPDGTVVLDPFCGSGTALVEAQRLGLSAVGVDVNPIACLQSRVKTGPILHGLEQAAERAVDTAQALGRPHRWSIPNVDHWFRADVQASIAALVQAITAQPDEKYRDALRLALSAILVRVSRQESDTRYAAVDKAITGDGVFQQFVDSSRRIASALASRDWQASPPSRVIQHDLLDLQPSDIGCTVGLIITSPPYPNAYEYWLYHKYRMWWLGYDPLWVKAREIGARAHFFKRNHHTASTFGNQMERAFRLFSEVLVEGGFAGFVVGTSKIHGRIVDNAGILQAAASQHHMRLIAQSERTLSPSRKAFNLSHARIKTETVLVFQKE